MRILIAIALLLLASNVSAKGGKKEQSDIPLALLGVAEEHIVKPAPAVSPRSGAGVEALGNRRLLSSMTGRGLLGTDGSETQSRLVVLQKQCPDSGNADYDTILYTGTNETLGELISDNGICVTAGGDGTVVTSTSGANGVVYGGTAQDFGATKPNWESYGWSLFYVPMPPEDDPVVSTGNNITRIQGINLHVIGNIGLNSPSTSCSLSHVSVGIYNAHQTTYAVETPDTPIVQNKMKLTAPVVANGVQDPFTWTGNASTILYTDIVDINASPNGVEVTPGNYYWLRIKLHAAYSTTGSRCFAFWGLSSTVHNAASVKGRWQEAGGSSGFSTRCSGALGSPGTNASPLVPGEHQTFFNCWNNGARDDITNPLRRRCLTYRKMVDPEIPAADCTGTGAQFLDYNYALVGFQGENGVTFGSGK